MAQQFHGKLRFAAETVYDPPLPGPHFAPQSDDLRKPFHDVHYKRLTKLFANLGVSPQDIQLPLDPATFQAVDSSLAYGHHFGACSVSPELFQIKRATAADGIRMYSDRITLALNKFSAWLHRDNRGRGGRQVMRVYIYQPLGHGTGS